MMFPWFPILLANKGLNSLDYFLLPYRSSWINSHCIRPIRKLDFLSKSQGSFYRKDGPKTYTIRLFFGVKEHSNPKKSPSASPNPHQPIVYNYIPFFQGLLFSLRNFLYSAGPKSVGKIRSGTRKSFSVADSLSRKFRSISFVLIP